MNTYSTAWLYFLPKTFSWVFHCRDSLNFLRMPLKIHCLDKKHTAESWELREVPHCILRETLSNTKARRSSQSVSVYCLHILPDRAIPLQPIISNLTL